MDTRLRPTRCEQKVWRCAHRRLIFFLLFFFKSVSFKENSSPPQDCTVSSLSFFERESGESNGHVEICLWGEHLDSRVVRGSVWGTCWFGADAGNAWRTSHLTGAAWAVTGYESSDLMRFFFFPFPAPLFVYLREWMWECVWLRVVWLLYFFLLGNGAKTRRTCMWLL